jgi:hypothetical protein
MRTAVIMSILIMTQLGWGVSASGGTPPASAQRPLTLIPTAFQELNELRIYTGKQAVLNDGTMNAVYVKNFPAKGSTYLNFHVDIASEDGPFVLRTKDIRLEKAGTQAARSYTPLDWFINDGQREQRGASLTVNDKALIQFTIEVPRAGLDDLTLFVRSQRIGTVGEIRARIVRDRGSE